MIRKSFLSVIILLLVVFTLATSTFAWFSLADTNEVSDINITVGGGETLQISLNGKDYYSSIPSNLFLNYIKGLNGDKEVVMTPVTTTNGRDIKDLDGNILKDIKSGLNINFIKLRIYFKATDINDTEAEKYQLGVYINNFNYSATYESADYCKGTYIVSKGISTHSDVNFVDYDTAGNSVRINDTDLINKHAANAIKIAFYDNQYTFYGSQDLATKYYDLSSQNGNLLYPYGYGFGYSRILEDLKGSASYYYEKTKEILIPEELTVPVYNPENGFSEFGQQDKAMFTNNDNGFICYLTPVDVGVYEGCITLLIWLEGYDSDCLNFISNDEIIISLDFKVGYKNN